MVGSLFSGLSGMRSYQTQLEVIGNNISNMNTVGFKAGRVTVRDMFSKTLVSASGGSGASFKQLGSGVNLGSIDTLFTQGSMQATNRMTDIAIWGNGFFVLSNKLKLYHYCWLLRCSIVSYRL